MGGGSPFTGNSVRGLKVGSGNRASLSMGALLGEPVGWRGFITGDPGRYVEKDLETGISFRRGPAVETWKGDPIPGTLKDE